MSDIPALDLDNDLDLDPTPLEASRASQNVEQALAQGDGLVFVEQRPLSGRPRVNLNPDERAQIWEAYISNPDITALTLQFGPLFRTNREAILAVIVEQQENMESRGAALERLILVEHNRRMVQSMEQQLHDSAQTISVLNFASKRLESKSIAANGAPDVSSLDKDEFDRYMDIVRARQYEKAAIAKISTEIRNYNLQIANYCGVTRIDKKREKKIEAIDVPPSMSKFSTEELRTMVENSE